MNSLKKLLAVAAVMAVAVIQASALSLTTSDSYYIGSVDNGTPSDEGSEAAYINYLVNMTAPSTENDVEREDVPGLGSGPQQYDFVRSANDFGSLPAAVDGERSVDDPDPTLDVTGWTYLYGKFGNTGHVWYVGGLTGEVTLPDLGQGGGLSHWTLFTPGTTEVPDGGATAAMLGLGVLGLAAIRRKS